MKKITRFRDVPQFTSCGQWECDFTPDRLVAQVDEWVREDGLDLNPDFQRGHVWTPSQQAAFVEFFLRGGKTARVLYFNNPQWRTTVKRGAYSKFVIVDGLQRLTAIRAFINDEIKVFGSRYSEFEDSIRQTNTMRLNVNDLRTRAEVLQWYLDFNSGGTVHSDEELAFVAGLLEGEKRRNK